MIYLNNFRIFILLENILYEGSESKIKLHKYIYFPKIDFSLNKIS